MSKNKQLKDKLNLIREKYGTNNDSKTESYARLLKRRRMEQRKTLEEVAAGVCSTSYLCRIENAQVEVDDQFFEHLFEKLEISYEEVKEQNKTNVLKELLKFYLQRDFNKMHNLGNKVVTSNVYSDIELKLVVLFLNILEERYEEARLIIIELERLTHILVGFELITYTFLSALLSYKINNIVSAFKLLRVLEGITYEDEILHEAVIDLTLSVYSIMDEDVLFIEAYHTYKSFNTPRLSTNEKIIHEFEYLLINGKNDYNQGVKKFNELCDYEESDVLKEAYYYNLIKLNLFFNEYNKSFELLEKAPMTSKMICLLDYCINNCNNLIKAVSYIEMLRKFKFTKYESFHLFYNEFTIKKIEKMNNFEIADFIKRNFMNNKYEIKELKNCLITKNIYYLYMESLYEIGKYKEIAKYSLELRR